ncbi:uncharacterized protein LOC144095578 [Amblyomma americanum]
MAFPDLSELVREILRRSNDLRVVPYGDTPRKDDVIRASPPITTLSGVDAAIHPATPPPHGDPPQADNMLKVAYGDLIERGHEHDMDINNYVAYRQFTRWIWGRLGIGHREVIPSCTVSMIRKMFPSGSYTDFKRPKL